MSAVNHKLSCDSHYGRPCNCGATEAADREEVDVYTLEVDEVVVFNLMAAGCFVGVFTIGAIVLKALGWLAVSWWWVTAAVWVPWAVLLAVLTGVLVVYFIRGIVDGIKAAKERR